MTSKPIHYDGSVPAEANTESVTSELLQITDEMRLNISANPYEVKA
ncbi:hypothetical protein [Bacillus sp. HMF5848]|nr:hypothetical protein [Bacillus sp. HMF5848]